MFSAGLQGNELFDVSLKGLLEHDVKTSNLGCVLLPLLEKFKGERRLDYHLIPIADTASTVIDNRFWIDKSLGIKKL